MDCERSDAVCCEKQVSSELGPVADTERLARIVISPTHLRPSGGLKPSIFAVGQLSRKTSDGVSLTRLDVIEIARVREIADHIASYSPTTSLHGVIVGHAISIRSISNVDGQRALCVQDDPVAESESTLENPAHALTGTCDRALSADDPEIERLRKKLLDQFRGPLSFDQL